MKNEIDVTANFLEMAVRAELHAGNEKYGAFHSAHEAYAVLLEETEEIQTEFYGAKIIFNMYMPVLWENVKKDKSGENLEDLAKIKAAALVLANECIQVAAMCDKWTEYEEGAQQ